MKTEDINLVELGLNTERDKKTSSVVRTQRVNVPGKTANRIHRMRKRKKEKKKKKKER